MQNFVCALQDWSLFPPVLWGTPFSWVLVHTRFCLCPPGVSVSPVLWKFRDQIQLTFIFKFPRGSQSLCQIRRLGSLTWGSEYSQQCENFFGIIILQSVCHPSGGCRIWFYRECTPPVVSLLQLLCLLMWGSFLWWIPASSFWWLFKSWLQFGCSCRRRWVHTLLLCHLVPNAVLFFIASDVTLTTRYIHNWVLFLRLWLSHFIPSGAISPL